MPKRTSPFAGLFVIVVLLVCMVLTATGPSMALDDDEYNGYAADTLTIKVGYFGGPYYEKHIFTLDELWALDVVYADYTFIDNMPSAVIDHVAGVRIVDLMEAAGIDLNSVQTFFFWTRDKQNDYYTSYTKKALVDTPRYCYYSLPDNMDKDTGRGNEYATSDGVPVDTVLALADDWNRVIAGATFGSDYTNLNTNTRFRLIFGQTNGFERTASRSAKWIHEIVVELGGAPTITLDASVLEGEVGSVLRTEPRISADSAVKANEKVMWSSSDESVATVDQQGNITVQGEGSATVTASFAGVSASVVINGSPGNGEGGPENGADAGENGDPNQDSEITEPNPEDAPKPNAADPDGGTDFHPSEIRTDTEEGGVQNWRMFEMSETATALPDIETDNPLLGFIGIAAAGLFLGSGIVYAGSFYTNIGRKKYVHKRKPD